MLWLEHISPEQLQMGIAVCSLLTELLLIVTLHKINRIQRYIQKSRPAPTEWRAQSLGALFRRKVFRSVRRQPKERKNTRRTMLIDEVIEEVFS